MSATADSADGRPTPRPLSRDTGKRPEKPNRDVTWEVLSEKINDLIILADATGTIFYASPACKALGYAQHELIGRTAADFVHPEDLAHAQANVAVLFGATPTDAPLHREHRYRRGDGSWVWLEGNPSLIHDPQGKPIGLVNVFRDVSDKHATREALAEQTRKAAMAEEIAGVGYWRMDTATQEITWSDQMFHIYGLERGPEPPLATAMAMTHPEDLASSRALLEASIATGVGWAELLTRIVRPDGDTRYISGRAVCEADRDGRVTAVFGTLVDITEQHLARLTIEASERRYRLLTEHATDMISQTASDGRMIYVSPSVERVTGYSIAEVMPRRMTDFVHPDDLKRFLAFYGDLVSGQTDGGHPIRYRVRHKDGAWIWLESNPRLVKSTLVGEPDAIIDVTRDVTEQQALKHQLRGALAEAERATAVKSEFLANMSHEIRTPLTAVLGFASLLAERRDLDEAAQGQIGRIAGAGRALLAVVNDVLDFSKLEAGEITIRRRPACPEQAAREVLEMFGPQAAAKGLDLRFEAAVSLPRTLVLDEDRLRQILINLVGNAVKFTDRGRVSLALGYDAAGQLVAEVADTGPGIAADAKTKLFQRFSQIDGSSTRTKGGSGLGLAICHGLALAMGGAVSVTSRVGRGSTFRLTLPALPGVAEAPTGTRASDLERLYGLRVLVVDDNAVNREIARAVLESVGVEVSEVHDGREAVDVARRLPFDAILMDLRMPGLDGRAATAAIRREPGPNQHMPILAFSADGVMDLSAPQNACFQGVVLKPTSPPDLFKALLRAMDEEPVVAEGTLYAAAS